MAYTYDGLTAYVKESTYNNIRFEALQFLVPLTRITNAPAPYTGMISSKEFCTYMEAVNSPSYGELKLDFAKLTPVNDMFPIGTPNSYKVASITKVNIKGNNLYRLHFPVAAKTEKEAHHTSHNLFLVIFALFGDDILGVKSRTASSKEQFDDAKELVVMSAEKENTQ